MEGGDNEISSSIVNLIYDFGSFCSSWRIVYVVLLFESWEGDFRVVCAQDSLVAIGKTFCDWGSISPREIRFIVIARQTQVSYHQNC
jgi:hypothetical protein